MTTSSIEPAWRTTTIADGSRPVGFARLDRDPEGGAFAALVRFPAGWERPATGRYAVDEELFVLEGEFRMSGVGYRTDEYALIPAGYVRAGSAAPQGALVIAFFTGPADWIRVAVPAPRSPVRPVRWRDLPPRGAPVAAVGRPLGAGDGRATWLVESTFAARAPRHERLQLFSLPARSWATVAPGDAIPPMRMPCLCRLRTVSRADAVGAAGVDERSV